MRLQGKTGKRCRSECIKHHESRGVGGTHRNTLRAFSVAENKFRAMENEKKKKSH